MKTICIANALCAAIVAGILVAASCARADDLTAPAPGASSDFNDVNQVLEIPQQCDKDAVAVLCDRGESDSTPQNDASAQPPTDSGSVEDGSAPPSAETSADNANAVYGSIDDYQHQYETAESSAAAIYLPAPVYVPMAPRYTFLAPAPYVIGSPIARGPRFLSPLRFGHHSFRRR